MYYEEKVIDGVLHCRSRPDGEWRELSAKEITAKLMTERKISASLRQDVDEMENELSMVQI